jgi:hypothetical protein
MMHEEELAATIAAIEVYLRSVRRTERPKSSAWKLQARKESVEPFDVRTARDVR